MFRSLRKGPATNSSSTHSLIMHSSEEFATMHDAQYLDTWGDPQQNYVLRSPEQKMRWLAGADRWRLQAVTATEARKVEAMMRDCGLEHDLQHYLDEASDIRLLSSSTISGMGLQDIDLHLVLGIILDPNFVIYGYYDNNPCFAAVAKDSGVFTLTSVFRARQDGEAVILYDQRTGNKLRWSRQPYEKSSTPELVDVKVTDFCGFGCEFCYMGSTKKGKHAPIRRIEKVFRELAGMGVFELAIGGGEPAHHPRFADIIALATKHGINFNFTAYGIDWIKKPEVIAALEERSSKRLMTGVGISVHKEDDLTKILRAQEELKDVGLNSYSLKLMAQTVVGATPYSVSRGLLEACIGCDIPLLLLGFKTTGRGADFVRSPEKLYEIRDLLERAKEGATTPDEYGSKPQFTLSVDTCFVDAYSDLLEEFGIPEQLWASPEGAFSMYVDAVEDMVAPSSYCDASLRQPRGDIAAQFREFTPIVRSLPVRGEEPKDVPLYEGDEARMKGTAADGSEWDISVETVLEHMVAGEDPKFPFKRPITRQRLEDYLGDHSLEIEGWELVRSHPPSPAGIIFNNEEL